MLTIGVFDGVHLGHQQLIARLTQEAIKRDLLSGVITFSRHPRVVLAHQARLARLTTIEEKIRLLKDLGIDFVVPLTFSEKLAELSARQFVTLLRDHLQMQGLVIGPNFALGKKREGNVASLKELGRELGFTVEVIEPRIIGDYMASSTAIRKALAQGDMAMTSKLLGRYFNLSGVVEGGRERGHVLGYPTANIRVDADHALPPDGVYATLGHIGDQVYQSVTNIGLRPTFNEEGRTIEVFLFDFDGDLYGQRLTIELVEYLRGEEKFASAEELVAQIRRDIDQARLMLDQALVGVSRG